MRVVELFAGVGGFRVGFEEAGTFEVVWANQWEPSTRVQHAPQVYVDGWGLSPTDDPEVFTGESGDVFVNKDISTIDSNLIPTMSSCVEDSLVRTTPSQRHFQQHTVSQGRRGCYGGKYSGFLMKSAQDTLFWKMWIGC